MIRYFVHRGSRTELVDHLDAALLSADSGAVVWADVSEPTEADGSVLRDVFGFHELAVEAALKRETHPKVESYGRYLYLVLHGIDYRAAEHCFDSYETDFFLAANFLVTVHDGQRRSIAHVAELCGRADHILAEGPVALLHRIVDTMVDQYRPEVDELEERLDEIEEAGHRGAVGIADRRHSRGQARRHRRCGASWCRSATWWGGCRGASST